MRESLFSDQRKAWETPYHDLKFAVFNDYLVVQISENDCVDYYEQRTFIVSPEGLVVQRWPGTPLDGYRESVIVENGELTFWSEWYCNVSNPSMTVGPAVVDVYSTSDNELHRREVDRSIYCDASANLDLIRFSQPERLDTDLTCDDIWTP